METEEITIRVNPKIAREYRESSEAERQKINLLISFYLQVAKNDSRTLEEIMDEMSREAEKNGLTPEILEEILEAPIKHIL